MCHMVNTVNLKEHQLLCLNAADSQAQYRVLSGTLWVTIAGCEKDYVLYSGDLLPHSTTDLLIECLSKDAVFFTYQIQDQHVL